MITRLIDLLLAVLLFLVLLLGLNLDICIAAQLLNGSNGSKHFIATGMEVDRALTGSGFHRIIETTLLFGNQESAMDHCKLLLVETLPSGVYADPFQLKQTESFGGPKVLFDRAVDIEAPEYLSKPHKVSVFFHMNSEGKASVSLPIHARYHKPSPNRDVAHSEVTIPSPQLFSLCSSMSNPELKHDAPCDESNSTFCKWSPISYPFNNDAHVLQMSIPHGQSEDKLVVTIATLTFTIGMSALLIFKLFCSNFTHEKSM